MIRRRALAISDKARVCDSSRPRFLCPTGQRLDRSIFGATARAASIHSTVRAFSRSATVQQDSSSNRPPHDAQLAREAPQPIAPSSFTRFRSFVAQNRSGVPPPAAGSLAPGFAKDQSQQQEPLRPPASSPYARFRTAGRGRSGLPPPETTKGSFGLPSRFQGSTPLSVSLEKRNPLAPSILTSQPTSVDRPAPEPLPPSIPAPQNSNLSLDALKATPRPSTESVPATDGGATANKPNVGDWGGLAASNRNTTQAKAGEWGGLAASNLSSAQSIGPASPWFAPQLLRPETEDRLGSSRLDALYGSINRAGPDLQDDAAQEKAKTTLDNRDQPHKRPEAELKDTQQSKSVTGHSAPEAADAFRTIAPAAKSLRSAFDDITTRFSAELDPNPAHSVRSSVGKNSTQRRGNAAWANSSTSSVLRSLSNREPSQAQSKPELGAPRRSEPFVSDESMRERSRPTWGALARDKKRPSWTIPQSSSALRSAFSENQDFSQPEARPLLHSEPFVKSDPLFGNPVPGRNRPSWAAFDDGLPSAGSETKSKRQPEPFIKPSQIQAKRPPPRADVSDDEWLGMFKGKLVGDEGPLAGAGQANKDSTRQARMPQDDAFDAPVRAPAPAAFTPSDITPSSTAPLTFVGEMSSWGDIDTPSIRKRRSMKADAPVKEKKKRVQRRRQLDEDEDYDDDDLDERGVSRRQQRKEEKKRKKEAKLAQAPPTILLPELISIQNLGDALGVKKHVFLQQLEEMGFEDLTHDTIMTGETAALVAQEYGFDPTVETGHAQDLKPRPAPEDPSSLPPRPPIVTIMGHVDHGKTTMLDWLRKSSVAAQEHGGITQHIGAFSVNLSSGKPITFLDTPGHAAFLSMRQRGANVTDIVILVVAADDSVKPQTLEALKHAQAAKVPIIVAINKIDKDEARIDQVKADLARHGVEIEDYGGDVQVVCVSGKTGLGMNDLEENILTLSEILDVRAEPDGMAEGWVLESSIKPIGRVATVLVKRGTLRKGDIIVAGTAWARVRVLMNEAGVEVEEAPPGTPVEVLGWDDEPPAAGEMVLQAPQESLAKVAVAYRLDIKDREDAMAELADQHRRDREKARREAELEALRAQEEDGETSAPEVTEPDGPKMVNFVVKGDVMGSIEAVTLAVQEIGNNEVRPRVLRSSPGQITESDVDHAAVSGSYIINFNLPVTGMVKRLAEDAGVRILDHTVIYHMVDEVKQRLSDVLPPLVSVKVTGEADVQQIFPINVKGRVYKNIAGCRVRNGVMTKNGKYKVLRKGVVVHEGALETLKHGKKDVSEIKKGMECGMEFLDWQDIREGDQIQAYEEVSEKRYL